MNLRFWTRVFWTKLFSWRIPAQKEEKSSHTTANLLKAIILKSYELGATKITFEKTFYSTETRIYSPIILKQEAKAETKDGYGLEIIFWDPNGIILDYGHHLPYLLEDYADYLRDLLSAAERLEVQTDQGETIVVNTAIYPCPTSEKITLTLYY